MSKVCENCGKTQMAANQVHRQSQWVQRRTSSPKQVNLQNVTVTDENGMPTDKTRKKIIYSGYVFVEMIMSDYAWYVVRNTPGVTGFVGSSGKGTKPFPIPRDQIAPVLKRMGEVDDFMYAGYGNVVEA